MSAFYQKPYNVQHVPIDIIGYSRGCFEALYLSNYIQKYGVPDYRSVRSQKSTDPKTSDITGQYFNNFFHPKIRFVGVVSPVYERGLATLTAFFTEINLVPTQLLIGGFPSFTEIDDGQPVSQIYPQTNFIPGPGTSKTSFTASAMVDHPEVGINSRTLATLLNSGRAANCPVPDAKMARALLASYRLHSSIEKVDGNFAEPWPVTP